MQVQDTTFNGMKANGMIPAHADFNNPNHTKRAGEILAAHLFDKYRGDPARAAAAYYGGEKAVTADGRILDFGNKERPGDPTTHQYAKEILQRMGLS